jgi:hypothetical protein
MMISKKALARRTFLRGMGVTLALPFVDAMVPAFSVLAQTAGKPAQRMGFFYVPNGIQLVNFLPKTDGRDFEMTPILSPLTPFRDQLTIVSGLANKQADPLDLGTGSHTRSQATWLSGSRPKRTEGADIELGTTLDQFAAKQLGADTPLGSLEIGLEPNFITGNCEGGYSCAYINTFSWRSATSPMPMETNPQAVFERLFGDGGSAAGRAAQRRKDKSILDEVSGDLKRLQGSLGPGDRTIVDEYVEAVREVEQRLQRIEKRAETSPTAGVDAPVGVPDSFEEHANLMFDLQLLAYQADLTRVVTFQIGRELSARSYPNIGIEEAHHDISHHQNNPERMAKNTKINTFHMELFARFLARMRATPDGDGSLLDHSMLMYGAGMGDGNVHSAHNLPIVLLGGGCGRLSGGRHLKAPLDTPLMNLGLSLLDKVGVELEAIGDSTGRLSSL